MCTYTVRVGTIEEQAGSGDENGNVTLTLSCEIIGLGEVTGSAEVSL